MALVTNARNWNVARHITEEVERRMDAICSLLCYVGEACITEAREGGKYNDITGNLRSSIGYAVLRDGRVVQRNNAQQTKAGAKGTTDGAGYLTSVINKVGRTKGLRLVVTAGMQYAEYVEARGLNVLTSAELKAESMVKSMLTRLGFKVR